MPSHSISITLGLAGLTLALAGCPGGSNNGPTNSQSSTPQPANTTNQHVHAHPTHGPHDGDLIELGNEEYHAELLHDEQTGTVTIYLLDGAASEHVPIEATEITINAKRDGQPKQFSLAADPDENDPEGKSSRFVSNDSGLAASLDEHDSEPRLALTINGKPYRGEISHEHSD
jgi:hypothetical protein